MRSNPQPKPNACGELRRKQSETKTQAKLLSKLNSILKLQNSVASASERKRFANQLCETIRFRKAVLRVWSSLRDESDIITLIRIARDAGDLNEAIWRSFLAAHFGRPSARGEQQIQSAAKFLCAYRSKPIWTWKRVSKNPAAFEEWLFDCAEDLESIRFGNHRKYESPKPELILETIESFVSLVEEYVSPAKLLVLDGDETDGFDVLYKRLRPVKRFGRTGRFDFLVLLGDMKLMSVEPRRGYLQGSTGPKNGAKLLWGNLTPKQLESLATHLANELGVSPIVMEDCLCNWQK